MVVEPGRFTDGSHGSRDLHGKCSQDLSGNYEWLLTLHTAPAQDPQGSHSESFLDPAETMPPRGKMCGASSGHTTHCESNESR